MSQCLIVLGMHRSGTSCLTRILNRAGMQLGEELINEPAADNLQGHWEDCTVVGINEQILALSGGAWDRVPDHLTIDDETTRRIVRFVSQFQSAAVWGWKDPRTTLTYFEWERHLPPTKIVACVRHPYAVAKSLAVREGWPIERGLQLWLEYNKRLLEIVDQHPNVCWYQHGIPPQQSASQIQAICDAGGLIYSDELLELINPHLDHNATASEIVEPEIRDVYDRLMAHVRRTPDGSECIDAAAPQTPDRLTELTHELHRLCEVMRLTDVAHQHTAGVMRQLEDACRGMRHEAAHFASHNGQHFGAIDGRLNQLEHALGTALTTIESQRAQIVALQNVLPLRVYRAVGEAIKRVWKLMVSLSRRDDSVAGKASLARVGIDRIAETEAHRAA